MRNAWERNPGQGNGKAVGKSRALWEVRVSRVVRWVSVLGIRAESGKRFGNWNYSFPRWDCKA